MEDPAYNSFFNQLKQSINGNQNLLQESGIGIEGTELIGNLEKYFNVTTREVMIPRTLMITIEKDQTLKKAAELFQKTNFSRIPVQDQKRDNIVGVIYALDLFDYFDSLEEVPIHRIMREPYFVSYSLPIHDLLSKFRKVKSHLAIVVDEHGGVDGLITIDDVIEELVGEIPDENRESDEPDYEQVEDGLIIMDANMELDQFNNLYNSDFNKNGIETIGGFVCHSLGKIPSPGESFQIKEIQFTVVDSNERNIKKLKLTAPED